LSWSSTNATSCTASGGWSGTLGTTGSQATGALTATTAFTIACTGPGGSATQSVTITVTLATETATLTWSAPTTNTNGTPVTDLTGYNIYYGQSSTLTTPSHSVSGATNTTWTTPPLTAGTWYFAVTAVAADGTESSQSPIGTKTIP
jgi:hypothetical protein